MTLSLILKTNKNIQEANKSTSENSRESSWKLPMPFIWTFNGIMHVNDKNQVILNLYSTI